MRKLTLLLLCCFAWTAWAENWTFDGIDEGWSGEEIVLQYFHNSELQRQWAWELIGLYPLASNDRVLDFGCGDGKLTALMSHSLVDGQIIGYDLSGRMVDFARRSFPSVYYPTLSFEVLEGLEGEGVPEDESFDRITSFCVFHLVRSPEVVLTRLYRCAKKGGRLFIVSPAGRFPEFFQAAAETFETFGIQPPWAGREELPDSMRLLEGARTLLTRSGWEVEELYMTQKPFCFVNRQETLAWLIGTIAANWRVPREVADSFFSQMLDRLEELCPAVKEEDGTYQLAFGRIHAVAVKRGEP